MRGCGHRRRFGLTALLWAGLLLLTAAALLIARPLLAANGAPSTPDRPPAAGQASAATSVPLLQMLALVPNTPEYRTLLTWGDAAAWFDATAIPRVDSFDEAAALPEAERDSILYDLFKQTVPPDALGVQHLRVEKMRERYGFDFFDADQMLGAGQPPDSLAIVTVGTEPATIDAALSSTGYTMTQTAGASLYHLRGDYEVDMRDESMVGRLGALNRIALIEDAGGPATVVIGRATAPVEAALESGAGAIPSLAGDPLYRFVAENLTDGTFDYFGKLVGLMLVEPQPGDPMAALGMESAEVQAQLEAYQREPMPPTLLHAFATFRDGPSTVLMLVAVLPTYYPEDQTEDAAALLYDRMGSYISVATGAPLDDRWTRDAYGTMRAGILSAAYVTMRRVEAPGSHFSWSDLIYRRDLLFLTPGNQP